jgi:hypothetical protein
MMNFPKRHRLLLPAATAYWDCILRLNIATAY